MADSSAQTNGDLKYFANGTTITITGYIGKGGAVTIPDTIAGLPVTSVGYAAFQSGTNLTSVTIPETVTNIGQNAFYYCTNLAGVNIPKAIVTIGECAFASCHNLTNIDIDPNNSIYCSVDGALFNKARTILLQCPGGKAGTYALPNGVTTIGNSAFSGCDRLTSVTVSGSVTNIGYDAFSWCSSMTNIAIPMSVKVIGTGAFWDCSSLREITIPNVSAIQNETFSGCYSLASITLPASITSIESAAFRSCTNLASVYFEGNAPKTFSNAAFTTNAPGLTLFYRPSSTGFSSPTWNGLSSATYYGSSDLKFAVTNGGITITGFIGNAVSAPIPSRINGTNVIAIGNGAFMSCISLTCVSIPNSVTDIGSDAFSSCISLASVTIPNSVKNIGPNAFQSCNALTNLTLGNSVTSIGAYAFYHCGKLASLTIPGSVTNIDSWAFFRCTSLTNAYFLGNAPESFGTSVFSNASLNFTICYLDGASGFTTPTWNGYPSVVKQVIRPALGIRTKGALHLSGELGAALRIEFSDQLGTNALWKPLTHLNFSDSTANYIDTSATNAPMRFYRVVSE